MNIGNFIKNLAGSKTVRRIVYSTLSFVAVYVIPNLPAEIIGPYGPAIQAVLAITGLGSAGAAVKGRVDAQGPITDQPKPSEAPKPEA